MNQVSSFGGFVRQHRRELDLTQDELARRVGCAAITLRKIEADDLRASVQIAERLAMALAIPLEERAEFVRWARSVRPESLELPPVTPPPSMEEIGREDLTGRAIRGYALAERIGMGGMGSVYRAVQPNVEREVAVKIILPAFANHPDFIRRFEAEAQLVARLEHPHIVPLYDYWREPGVAYLVMRLLRGGNIQNVLKQGPMSIDTSAHMLEQICSALNAAHRIGVIHRDLKPANVLLDEDSNAYLADFGIAKNLGDPDFENQTQADAMIGSPQYMSPEQIRSLSVRPQTDIYCLGVMMYEMLTGTLPFAGPTPFDMIQQHINTPMPPLAAHKSGLPAALDAVIKRATAKDPEERYADVLSLFNDFRQAIGSVVNAHPTVITYEEEDSDLEIANPFKGLRAFSEADAENFFGRETLVQQLLARLGEGGDLSRFLAVIGPSGSGKSSVVRAGLIPALRRGGLPGSENWFIVDMLPGKHPFEELEAAMLRVAVNPPQSLLSQLKDGNRGLLRAVHRILPADESVELVLVIDQFEEVFTLVEDEAERALLLESIATAVLDERSRLRVIVTLRADFTDKPLRYVDFGEMMNRRFEFILPLTADEAERAIAGPAQRAGLRLEKGLVSTIIREAGNQPGTLPLLQHALSELFEKREGRTLTNKAYREIGGVLGALVRSAEVIYALLNEAGKSTARQLFLRLVTLGEGTEDTRRRVSHEELKHLSEHNGQLSVVTNAFGRARLLSFDHDPITRGPTIEVAHEALLKEWTRLREWLNESRGHVRIQRQLATAANEWQKANQDASFLLTGTRLEQFEGWAGNTTLALSQSELAFLDASIVERSRHESEEQARQQRELENAHKLAETERQRAEEQTRSAAQLRKRAYYLTGAFVIALIMAVAAIFFGRQAQTTSRLATSRELAAASISDLDIDPERSILLALQAMEVTDNAGQPPLLEAQDALHRAVQTSRVQLTLRGHTAGLMGLAYSPDGTRLATFSDDGTIKVWEATTGTELISIPTGELTSSWYRSPSFSPDGKRLAASAASYLAKVWDVDSGEELLVLSGHTNEVTAVIFSPDGGRIATSSRDHTSKIWDAVTGKELLTLNGQDEAINNVAFSPDGAYIATAGEFFPPIKDSSAVIWDAVSGEALFSLPVNEGINAVAFSPDGKTLATGHGNSTWSLWDVSTGEKLLTGFGHTSNVQDISFDPTGTRVITANEDGTAKIWEAATGRELLTLQGHFGGLLGAAFSPDGIHVATASRDNTARIWDVSPTGGGEWFNLIGHTDLVLAAAYSPDGNYIATGSVDFTAKIWDARTGEALHTLNSPIGPIVSLHFTPDSARLVTTIAANPLDENPSNAIIWDVVTGEQLSEISGRFSGDAALSPDGNNLATTMMDASIKTWDLNTGQELLTLTGSQSSFQPLAYSHDGKHLAAVSEDGSARVWDAATGQLVLTWNKEAGNSVSFSHDGKLIATASQGATVKIWDSKTGGQLYDLIGHTGGVFGVTFSPDDKYLASTSVDGTVKIWNVADNFTSEPLTLYGHTSSVYSVAFSPDGTRIVTSSRDGTARVYAFNIEDLVTLAQSRVTRTLTTEECQKYLHVEQCPTEP